MAEFVTASVGERRTLVVAGEVDLATVNQLETEATACLDDTPDVCEIDLSEVTFIDSSGLGALVRIRTLGHQRGKRIVLTNVPPSVDRPLAVTGLSEVFEIRPTG